MPTARLEVPIGKSFEVNGAKILVLFAGADSVLLELSEDEHPDSEVGASAADPCSTGFRIG
jgi:hypothetical protein